MKKLILIFLILISPFVFAAEANEAAVDRALEAEFDKIPERKIPAKNSYEYERFHFHWHPVLIQDPQTGRMLVDLTVIQSQILPELESLGLHVDAMELEADGGPQLGGVTIPVDLHLLERKHPFVIYSAGPVHQMHYCRVVLKAKGKEVHVTDNGYNEKMNFPKIDARAYANYAEVEITLPADLRERAKINPALVRRAGELQHQNVVWTVSAKNPTLQAAYQQYGSDLHPMPVMDRDHQWTGWSVPVPHSSQVLHADLEDIMTKGGAAFNQHSYFWDDHFVAEARASSDPKIALDTVVYWLKSQQPDGAIGRELDYKGKPFQRANFVKFGKTEPNRDFFNPLVAGWAWHEVTSWNPAQTTAYLPRVIEMMKKQREWLRKNHGVFDQAGQLIGFKWSNDGSGRDNSPRPIDETGIEALPKYGKQERPAPGRERRGLAVDLLAQYKTLIDYEREFNERLGHFDEAKPAAAESASVANLLNRRYYNRKINWYVDLVPSGATGWAQARAVTLAGFWPVAAKVPSRTQVAKMIETYLENPQKFGGLFLPSVPKDNPYYDEGGHYWRGGGWPPDWEMVTRAVKEYGFRAEAAQLSLRHMAAITAASDAYVKGDSPKLMVEWLNVKPSAGTMDAYNATHARIDTYFQKFWSGEIHNPEKTDPAGTVFEFYGVRRDPKTHDPAVTYGQAVRAEDSTVHLTRTGFAGWGAVVPLRSAHYIFGLDAVPPFAGSTDEVDRWLYTLLRDPELAYHQVRQVPAFQRLARFIEKHPNASFAAFQSELALQRTRELTLDLQLELLRQGYVELSPTFDPSGDVALKNFIYAGTPFSVKITRKTDGHIEVRVEGAKKIRLQVNRNWQGEGPQAHAVDEAIAASPIVEVGGDQPVVLL